MTTADATDPRIFDAQNSTDARRLVAAQARIYSDTKIFAGVRLTVVIGLSIAAGVVAIRFPGLRTAAGVGGGTALLAVSFVTASVEKRLRMMAAAAQEEFDTRVFRLDWNGVLVDRPPAARVAKAAFRYRGGRDANWYDDTEATHRPYDVLICQATNLGWGASMHRLWAWILSGLGLLAACGAIAGGMLADLGWSGLLTAVIVPALSPIKEIAEQIRLNFDNARSKESAERKIAELWAAGMSGAATPSTTQLRTLQDKILQLRQTNAFVPDWLDTVFHRRNEVAMKMSVQSRVEEARRNGHG
ncbi:S-4TM family putative pore-forming effector [Micromonospora sp. MED01]|uniref:S-4TM family putative pore-forming effector n=1 Tax=Micromonospora alfalfae TaxID=2911212 RepID=UPI001EE7A54B|nr:S-4TM family putative pore-forming effector [Micromonospora alfalfae]MCG5464843.1 S-4TM family putative pore-forming effector [Micromonospora alfalfae]